MGINNEGWIVGGGIFLGARHAFVLIPKQ
jgi:hypothetical protein